MSLQRTQLLCYALPLWCGILSSAISCGGDFSIVGSASTNRLARIWEASYKRQCPETIISFEDATSSTGAARVCGVRRDAAAVDVASMTRGMNRLEATTKNGWKFDCQLSTRKTVQVSTRPHLTLLIPQTHLCR
jgi:ABC-type phosphate transport system substrate-binding protein